MLKLKYLFENYDLAKTLLESWAHDEQNLDAMLSQFRISSNAVYPFCRNSSVCFLRIAPVDEKREENIVGEMEFIAYLIANDFPALKPIKTKNGEDYVKAATPWGAYYATAFEKVGGIQIEDVAITSEVAFAYGKSLGQLHNLAAVYRPRVKKWAHTDVIAWMRDALVEYNAQDCAWAELAAVEAALSALPRHSGNYGLVHYDFEADNVFYDAASHTCSVIDFGDGMYHWYALDIEQVFDSLGEVLTGDVREAAQSSFLGGYAAVRDAADTPSEMLPLMRRFINLYSYARLIRCVAEKFADEPAWLVELRAKLNKTISKLEGGFLAQ